MRFGVDIDMRGHDLLNAVLHSGTAFPAEAKAGQPFYRTDLKTLYVCTDAETQTWTPLNAGNGVSLDGATQLTFSDIKGNSVVPYLTISSSTYTIAGRFLFPGTAVWTPKAFKVFLVQDNNPAKWILACTTIFTNLPAGEAVFEVQAAKLDSSTTRIYCLKLDGFGQPNLGSTGHRIGMRLWDATNNRQICLLVAYLG